MGTKGTRKKTWASLIAGTLAAAIALTGTFAWQSFSQETINEIVGDLNPGGRVHDDLNGIKNKDIYAENFTDEADGAPLFVRIKLLEYMESGLDAGIKRGDANRDAIPLIPTANINDTKTWHLHKPEANPGDDPFHEYWSWDMGGKTVYMPTFNKNKDSLSVDVNGTYVGNDKNFETGKPYDDYETYTAGQKVTQDAYYDADEDNDADEYVTTHVGGPNGDGGALNTNYTAVSEEHEAKDTLTTAQVLTMTDWKTLGSPVGNFWVWDADGWFYWAAPLMPQTATGLLLDKVNQEKLPGKKCYYAIDMVGQFVTLDSIGTPNTANPGDPSNATGFHVDGVTGDALDLLDKASKVTVGADGNRYLSLGHNLYKQILDDEGNLGDPICAGPDRVIGGGGDDRTDVVETAAPVKVGAKDYGVYFLEPTATEPYYRALGLDSLLGTADDDRLWFTPTNPGDPFPNGTVADEAVDAVTVTADGNATTVDANGTLQFSAAATLGGNPSANQDVTWTVAGATSPDTGIDAAGLLTVGLDETADNLTVTATSKMDDRFSDDLTVAVTNKVAVTLSAPGSVTSIQAGKSLQMSAAMAQGANPLTPTAVTWTAAKVPALRSVDPTAVNIDTAGMLTVGRNVTGSVEVTAECEYGGKTFTQTETLTIDPPEGLVVTVTGDAAVEAGEKKTYTAAIAPAGELESDAVTWTVLDTDGNAIPGVSIASTGDATGELTVGNSVPKDTEMVITATASAPSSGGVSSQGYSVTLNGPTWVSITPNNVSVTKGKTQNFTVSMGSSIAASGNYPSAAVTWTVSGKANNGTTISASGLLTVAAAETASSLTVKATSKVDSTLSATATVTLKPPAVNVSGVGVGGTVTVDGIPFYVLAKQSGKALIVTKNNVGSCEWSGDYGYEDDNDFEEYYYWDSSEVRHRLHNWLNGTSTLKTMAIPTKINVEAGSEAAKTESVFLLSACDFGEDTGDYTVGSAPLSCKESFLNWIDASSNGWWLRTSYRSYTYPDGYHPELICHYYNVEIYNNKLHINEQDYEMSRELHPALWVRTA